MYFSKSMFLIILFLIHTQVWAYVEAVQIETKSISVGIKNNTDNLHNVAGVRYSGYPDLTLNYPFTDGGYFQTHDNQDYRAVFLYNTSERLI